MPPFTLTPRDALRLLYMVFFKPISLERYIHQVDPTLGEDPSIMKLWRQSHEHPEFSPLIWLACFHIIFMPFLAFPITELFALAGFDVNWVGVAVGVAVGMAVGVTVGVVSGVAVGVVISVAGGWMFGVAGGLAFGVAGGLAFGVAGGVTFGVACGWTFGAVFGVFVGLVIGVVFGVVGGLVFSLVFSLAFGVAFGTTFILSYLSVLPYLIYAPTTWQAARRGLGGAMADLWDKQIYFPLPGLDSMLLTQARQDRAAGLQSIRLVGTSLRQGWAAKRTLNELTLEDVQNAQTLGSIGVIAETLIWLPEEGRDDLKNFLPGIEQISQHARAAFESDTLYNRQEQLRSALKHTGQMRQGLSSYRDRRFAGGAGFALQGWEQIFQTALNAADAKEQIPNVYVAGSPLAEQSKVFKGRRDVFRALERELAGEAAQRPAILLFGARRSGKSSALKQLPVMLGPQVVPVTVDLQSLSLANDAAGLLGKMAAEIKSAALISRRFDLPSLPAHALQADPYAAFADWLTQVDAALQDRWMLLCLDEYEYLEKMLVDARLDERIFQLLRAMLQNYPRLTLLFSGAHTLEELHPRWSHHLINVRLLKIGHLAAPDARELVLQPIPSFPLRYAEGAAEIIFATLGGQPYLLQATCRDLVNLLNEYDRLDASPDDVAQALESALTSASAYFNDLWTDPDRSDAQRAMLTALAVAHGQPVSADALRAMGSPRDIQTLVAHDLIEKSDDGYHIKVALVRRWVAGKL